MGIFKKVPLILGNLHIFATRGLYLLAEACAKAASTKPCSRFAGAAE